MEGTIQKGSTIKESKLDLLFQEAESAKDASTQVAENIHKFAIKLVGVFPEESLPDRLKEDGTIPGVLYDLEVIEDNCNLINKYLSEME